MEWDTSSSQPEWDNQEIKGLNTGLATNYCLRPWIRKEAETLKIDWELRQIIKQAIEGKKELEPETGKMHVGKRNL